MSTASPASHGAAAPSHSPLAGWEAYLRAALAQTLDLPPMSRTSAAIAAMAADGNINTAVLAQTLERDPTVAANLLRVANSAALAPRVPVLTVPQAIAWLGLSEIQSIAMAVALRSKLFAGNSQEAALRQLWRQAVATAYWAREIARLKQVAVELAHLCGLLQRIGRPVVIRCLAQAPDGSALRLAEREREQLIDQFEPAAGAALCAVWNLPEPVSATIAHCSDDDYAGPWARQVRQVRLAGLLAARTLGQPVDVQAGGRIQMAIDALQMHAGEIAGLQASESAVRKSLAALD